jgi:transglutaminase-like putative cysteine protease
MMRTLQHPLQKIIQDPVFWVVLPLMLIIVPHIPRLPLWMPPLVLLLFSWRLLAILNEKWLPRKWILFVIVAIAALGTVLHYRTLFGKTAGTAILICLLALKLLESRKQRDFMLIIALSFFIIVTHFLFSQTIPTALYMLFTVVLLVTSLITLNQQHALALQQRVKLAVRMVVLALPLMLIMFVLFPRISGPLWHLPDDAKSGRTGLSDTMTPGSIAQLIQSDDIAFRVEFTSTKPSQDQLYWRALVLWYFDGRSWEQGKTNENPSPMMEAFGDPVQYTVTLEPHDKTWLFALDMPASTPDNSEYNNNFLLRAKNPVTSLQRYSLQSYVNYRINAELSRWERNAGLKLPDDANPKTRALGQQWRAEFGDDERIVRHALQQFNQQNYTYTLQPPVTLSDNPVDEFLFETRRGFCEHYASSFAVLMRAAGIPARVLLGYQGGTVNPLNNVLSVRQSDAHAWAEVWLANRGWVRVDPTAAIAPQRVETGLDAALGSEESRPLYMQLDHSVLRHLKFYWDAIDNRWKQWVIGYGPKLQQQLMQALFNRDMRYNEMAVMMIIALAAGLAILAIMLFKSQNKTPEDPVQKLYAQFCRTLARGGMEREPHEGPLDFAQRAAAKFPAQQPHIDLITRLYILARYGSRHSAEQMQQMRRLIRAFKLP